VEKERKRKKKKERKKKEKNVNSQDQKKSTGLEEQAFKPRVAFFVFWGIGGSLPDAQHSP
jgi:hypothetical protein